ncbi:ATP-binding cassette subfamily C protein CydC [Sphingomonas sp. PvP055]|uniref:amino acid ABC transporter ATP-binding/permease protein n=1 Tax=Sphingomonas sp. PvP055 TaxID=3156391 RepID=UPI00339391FE
MTPDTPTDLASVLHRATLAHRRDLRRAAFCAVAVAAATVSLLGLSGWFLTGAAVAASIGLGHVFNYMLPAVAIRFLAIVRTAARYGERISGHDAALRMMARVRPALFAALAGASPIRTQRFSTGEASARLVQDVTAIEAAIVRRSARWSLVGATVSAGALAPLGGWAPLVAVGATVVATIALGDWIARLGAAPARAALVANGDLKDMVSRYGAAAAELRCYGLEARAVADVADHGATLSIAHRASAAAVSWLDFVQSSAVSVAAGAAFVLAMPAGAPIAALAALAAAMGVDGAAPYLRDLAQRASVRTATERLDEILLQPDVADPPALGAAPQERDLALAVFGRVRFQPSERVAIIGRSGCGKTSLVETLLDLRPAKRGAVRIGGVDLLDIAPRQLSTIFALAPQDARLLAGTVRDNLLLADPLADEARLWGALHDAALEERIRALPLGLDSWIGEDGACLSGGERRRLSLARALVSRAPWLVLDEPTEGLDPATERTVLERIATRLDATGQGALIVTHSARVRDLCDTVADMTPPAATQPLETV